MKKLEGEVLVAITALGGQPNRYSDYPAEAGRDLRGQRLARTGGRFTVDPHQFYGLELNPRAVAIADLVLWIGYLKQQLKTAGLDSITEPVLDAYGTITQQDAVIVYDRQDLLRDAGGRPLSRWDGVTVKRHPVTGEEVPDPDAQMPLYRYVNPRRAPWPEAEFVVGNPPFVGGKDMRRELGDGYAEACWSARPTLPGGADFVMHFWDEAATLLLRKPVKGGTNPLRRFGFITTNSATQTFSRRVIERHMAAKEPLSLVYAVPDHPWLKAAGKAAVRIAMTVAARVERDGMLAQVASEEGLNTDTPQVALTVREGKIRADLTVGAEMAAAKPLWANAEIAHMGVKLHGDGFILESSSLGAFRSSSLIHPFVNGKDLAQRSRSAHVIDAFGLTEGELLSRHPAIYQYLTLRVRPERNENRREIYRRYWWIWGEPRKEWRNAKYGLSRVIATTRTARHRLFQFVPQNVVMESKVVGFAADNPLLLACLSSRLHVTFAIKTGGWLGVGNDPTYNHTECLKPFPFPASVDPTLVPRDPLFAQRERLRDLGERLDAFRKERLAEHSFLTMTGLYNALERLRELESGCDVPPLTDAERDVHGAGLISVLKELHDDIDRAVLAAYGWEDLVPALVGKPGATLPSPHKSEAQERAEEELLTRLVALNQERAAEERRGLVRWLRPDYQIPKLGMKAPKAEGEHVGALDVALPEMAERPRWPSDGLEQIRLVRDLLAKAPAPTPSEAIAGVFDGRATSKRRDRVTEVLETLVATGLARTGEHEGQRRYFLPR